MPDQEQTDNLDLAPKKSELATKSAAPKKKAAAKKTAAKRSTGPRKQTVPLPDNKPLPASQSTQEPIVDPLKILQMGGGIPESFRSDEESDANLNPIEDEKGNLNSGLIHTEQMDFRPNMINDDVIVAPTVRKVAIKKINRFNFRLGMEKTVEDYKLVPGTGHTWMCDKKGDQFITGLDDKPEEKARLERLLRVNLDNTSAFWSTLTFSLEDKQHGQIMNFDDKQMGPHYEVIYYAMQKSSMIANGLHEYSSGDKPFAEWYIENKEAEAEAKQKNMTYEIEADDAFKSLSLSRRAGTAKMLGLPVYGVSEKVASVELWEWLRKNTANAQEFLKLARMRDDQFAISVLVKDAIKLNVIRKNKANDLVYANDVLGPTEDHVVSKLTLATNADTRLSIQRMVEAKR